MQSIFRLPWCSEQLKLSDKPALDKVRPAAVVEIPALNKLKRKLSDCPDVPSSHVTPQHTKKLRPEVENPQQLPTPSSPCVNEARIFPSPEDAQHSLRTAPASTIVNETSTQHTSGDHSGDAAHTRPANLQAGVQPGSLRKELHSSGGGGGGDFMSKPVSDQTADMAAEATIPDPLSGLTPLQQVIENEFNMQILMKHNELRLIEQELAKCQIALEQLRRCELRPFPGSTQPDLSVSDGLGPTIAPPPGFSRPSHAPPYGVTDGPYSRHYRQWLLHDPQFDSMSPQAIAQAEHLANSNRSMRNAGHVRKTGSKSALATSTRTADPLQSIPNYPAPPPKDKNSPLVLRRSTDNQLVKLICNDCKRGNFSSIQGFLNHCRIAHKVDYKSHDAAAVDCGQLLEEHEVASLPPETATNTPKPANTLKLGHAPTRTQSVSIAPNKPGLSHVHPLNTPGATPVHTPGPRPRPTPNSLPAVPPIPNLSVLTPQSQQQAPFKPAANMPRLSAHFAKHKLGGDLAQAVANAQQKVDFGMEDEVLSPDTPEIGSPLAPLPGGKRMHMPGAGAMRPGTQDGVPLPRTSSHKGYRQPNQRPRPAPLAPAAPSDQNVSMIPSTMSSPHDLGSATLSPNAVDSNPGLVSDHEEDDDHASASDGESSQIEMPAPRHPLQPPTRSCEDHMDIDVQEDDEIDQHGVIIRRNSMLADQARGIRSAGSPSRNVGGK